MWRYVAGLIPRDVSKDRDDVILRCKEVQTNQPQEAAGPVLKMQTVPQFIKKFATFYESRNFIIAFTTARQQSLSSDRSVQYIHSLRISLIYSIHFNIIPLTTSGSSKWLLFLRFRQPTLSSPLSRQATRLIQPNLPYWIIQTDRQCWWAIQIMPILVMQFPQLSCFFCLSETKYLYGTC
jgi:hypothetical protein